MLLHYVECLDRNGWYRYELTFPSPYSAEQFAKDRRAANHTVRVVDEESGAEPAHGGVVSPQTWAFGEDVYRHVRLPIAVDLKIPRFGCC